MEKIKEIWGRYPRGWIDILVLLGIIISIAWTAAGQLIEIEDFKKIGNNAFWLKYLFTAAISGILYVIFDILYYASKQGAAIRLGKDIASLFVAGLNEKDNSEILVFASGGEDAKKRFLELTQEKFSPKRSITIKVLLRSDHSESRDSALQHLIERWRKDIDGVTSKNKLGYNFSTQFSLYEVPVMLKGYIFSESSAAISWYARGASIRSSPNIPMFVVSGKSEEGKIMIMEAKDLFDKYFEMGRKL